MAMSSSLPFHALHVFIEVVRRQGIRPAAEALHVTPGAVSRQVAMLEAHLGVTLLERRAGSLARPTKDGLRLLQRVQAPMDGVVQALSMLGDGRRQRSIIVNTSVTLAMHWLIPQIPRLQQERPGLQLEVQTDDGAANAQLPVDVFIRREPDELHSLQTKVFLQEQAALVVGSKLWAPGLDKAKNPHKCLQRWRRVASKSRPDLWPVWCRHHGIDESKLRPPLEFDNTVLAIQAVLQGLGVGVLPLPFLGGMLAANSLHVLPFDPVLSGHYAYAVRPGRDSARVRVFTDWLCQIGGMDPAA